jgi:hypothetical protein
MFNFIRMLRFYFVKIRADTMLFIGAMDVDG